MSTLRPRQTMSTTARPTSLLEVQGRPHSSLAPIHPAIPRRHSTIAVPRRDPRPFRSSPLAGPALSGDAAIDHGEESELSRTRSDSLLELPPPSPATLRASRRLSVVSRSENEAGPSGQDDGQPILVRPRASHIRRPKTAPESTMVASTSSQAPMPPPPAKSRLTRRLSFLSRSSDGESKEKQRANEVTPPVPAWTLGQLSGVQPSSSRPKSPSTSRNPSENWLTSSMYESTPRFSRLSLAAEGVVMPVSARDYSKLSRSNSRASMRSTASTVGVERSRRSTFIIDEEDDEDSFATELGSQPSLTRSSSDTSSSAPSLDATVMTPPGSSVASLSNSAAQTNETTTQDTVQIGGDEGVEQRRWKSFRALAMGSKADLTSGKSSRRFSLLSASPETKIEVRIDSGASKEKTDGDRDIRSRISSGAVRKMWNTLVGTRKKSNP